jgi:hypothetical protein
VQRCNGADGRLSETKTWNNWFQEEHKTMSYCEHCEGQRFDRARVLRALRQVRLDLRTGDSSTADQALELALQAVKSLEIPHLEWEDDSKQVVH